MVRGFRAHRGASERGSFLIEVVVSALMVGLIAAALAQVLIGSSDSVAQERTRSMAAQLAAQDQERLRGFSAEQLNNLDQTRTVTVSGYSTPFLVTSTASYLDTSGNTTCSSGGVAYYKTVSSVTWSGNNRPAVVEESDITPPAGGMLLVKTVDQTNSPLGGVSVTASGPDYESNTTSTAGCTALTDLLSGSYSVTLSETGYVDPNGYSSPPGLSSTVTATGVSSTSVSPVMLGQAGYINANFTTNATGGTVSCPPSSGVCTGQEADALTWFGSGSSSQMSADKTSSLSSPGTQVPASGSVALFPFYFSSANNYNNNYQVWPGKCAQMQPPTGVDQFTVSPGSSQTLAVQEPALNVLVDYNTATSQYSSPVWTRVAPAHVKLTYQTSWGSGPWCSDSWYASVASDAATDVNGSLASPGQPFASTSTTGSTASASGYTASYTVCADYNGYQSTVSSVQNNNYASASTATVQINPYTSFKFTC